MSSIIKAHTLNRVTKGDSNLAVAIPLTNLVSQAETTSHFPHNSRMRTLETWRKARQQAAELLETSQQKAMQLQEDARTQGYSEGYQIGYQQGLQEGKQEGLATGIEAGAQEARQTFAAAQQTLEAAENEKRQALAGMEADVIELALAIAEKIVQSEIKRDDTYLRRLLAEGIDQLGSTEQMTVRVPPESVERVAEMAKSGAALGKFQVVADGTLRVGDCVIETENGLLDGKLSSRFTAMRQALESVVES